MEPLLSSALIAFGGNLGNVTQNYQRCQLEIRQIPAIQLQAASRLATTHPVGGPPGQPAYHNGALRIRTSLSPSKLLAALQAIEDRLGRTRDQRWGARTVDLDLLLFDDQIIQTQALQLPHPRMAYRRFVLEPACEVAADMVHATTGWSIRQLRDSLTTAPFLLAICGPDPLANLRLLNLLATRESVIPIPRQSAIWQAEDLQLSPLAATIAQQLRDLPRQAGESWTVCDETVVGMTAWGKAHLVEPQQGDFFRLLERLGPQLVAPKLTVWLDASDRWLSAVRDDIRRFALQLSREMTQRPPGPVLHLDLSDWSVVEDEVRAALQAMKG